MKKITLNIAAVCLFCIVPHHALAKSSSGTKHKMYLGLGVSQPSFLGEGSGVGAAFIDGFNIAAAHTAIGSDSQTSSTSAYAGYGNGTAGIILGTEVANSSNSTSDDLYYAAGLAISSFGFGIRENEIGFLWGINSGVRIGATYNTESKVPSLGVSFELGDLTLAADYSLNSDYQTDKTLSTLGAGLGYFGSSFFLGLNHYSTTLSSGSSSTTATFNQAFIGYAASSFVLRLIFSPETEFGANNSSYTILAGMNF